MIEISNSSTPFCAYLGALLSVVKNVPVKPTIFPTNTILDTLGEEEEEEDSSEPSSNGDHGEESRAYRPSGSGGGSSDPPMTRSRRNAHGNSIDDTLMVRFPVLHWL